MRSDVLEELGQVLAARDPDVFHGSGGEPGRLIQTWLLQRKRPVVRCAGPHRHLPQKLDRLSIQKPSAGCNRPYRELTGDAAEDHSVRRLHGVRSPYRTELTASSTQRARMIQMTSLRCHTAIPRRPKRSRTSETASSRGSGPPSMPKPRPWLGLRSGAVERRILEAGRVL